MRGGVKAVAVINVRRDLLSARWCEPSLSVVDVRVGDDEAAAAAADGDGSSGDSCYRFGPTRFSVVPRTATGHVSIRFVPDQDASRLTELFRYAGCSCLPSPSDSFPTRTPLD